MTSSTAEPTTLFDYGDLPWSEFTPCERPTLNGLMLMITYFAVFLLSLVGNSVVVFVVCSMVNRRTSTDIYLMQLAIADLLFSLTLPFWAVAFHSEWIFGTFLCKLVSGIRDASFYGCVFLLACISVDRYLAIVKATQVVNWRRHLVKMVCALVWIAAAVLAMPEMLYREAITSATDGSLVCYVNVTAEAMDEWRTAMRITRHIVGFFLPLLVMLVCYGSTVCTLVHARNGQKQKAMRVILSVVLAFLACWLPITITQVVDTLFRSKLLTDGCGHQNRLDLALQVTQVLAFLHCAVNPILYAFIGKKFRNHFLHSLNRKGLIGKESLARFRKGSAQSTASFRVTSITL